MLATPNITIHSRVENCRDSDENFNWKLLDLCISELPPSVEIPTIIRTVGLDFYSNVDYLLAALRN